MNKLIAGCLVLIFGAGFICTLVGGVVFAPLMALAGAGSANAQGYGGSDSGSADIGSIIHAALLLSSRLEEHKEYDEQGKVLYVWNSYDLKDPELQSVIKYWKDVVCGNGTLCDLVAPGSLQCVSFVRGVLYMEGDPIGRAGDGRQFYDDPYGALTGWAKIPVGKMPQAGDIISWSNGGNPGHVGIIVEVKAPTRDGKPVKAPTKDSDVKDGDVIVAEGNAAGNYANPINHKNSLWDFKLKPDFMLKSWDGFDLEGYRRPPASYTTDMPSDGGGANEIPSDIYDGVPKAYQKYIPLAAAYATGKTYTRNRVIYKNDGTLPVKYFLRQIKRESGFNPNAESKAGAYGIAQFMADTAAGMHPPVISSDPDSSLFGAVQYMLYYQNIYMKKNFSEIEAFGLALVAYNGGGGAAAEAAKCGSNWRACIPSQETRDYVRIIMG